MHHVLEPHRRFRNPREFAVVQCLLVLCLSAIVLLAHAALSAAHTHTVRRQNHKQVLEIIAFCLMRSSTRGVQE